MRAYLQPCVPRWSLLVEVKPPLAVAAARGWSCYLVWRQLCLSRSSSNRPPF